MPHFEKKMLEAASIVQCHKLQFFTKSKENYSLNHINGM